MREALNIFSANDRRSTVFWLGMWALLAGGLLLLAHWESTRELREQMKSFETQTLGLSELAGQVTLDRLKSYDDVLLVLRDAFVADPKHFPDSVKRLRSGPLADTELLVVLVDRDGFLAYTDAPEVPARLYLGDRSYFRYFAESGADTFLVDEPVFGRATQRYSLPLARPIHDSKGAFLGVVALSVRQDALGRFGHVLSRSDNARVTLVRPNGAIVSRSHALAEVQGTRLPPETLAPMLQGKEGVYSRPREIDGEPHTIAYKRLGELPLILFTEAHPVELMQQAALQRRLLLASAGIAAWLLLMLVLGLLQRHKVLTRFIADQEMHLKEAQRIAEMGSWELDLKSQYFKWSDQVYRLFGIDRDSFDSSLENFLLLVADAERQAVRDEIEMAIREGQGTIEFVLVRGDGKVRRMLGHGESVAGKTGKAIALIGTVRDVTEQRAAEDALKRSEEVFRTLAQVLPVGIVRTDAKGKFLYVNERYCEITGQSVEEALAGGWISPIHPEDRARIAEQGKRIAATRAPFSSEYRLVRPTGEEVWVLAQAHPETNAQGEVTGFVGSVTDISVHKQAVEMAYRLILRNQVLMQNALDGIHILDDQGRVLEANLAFCALLGYTPAEVQELNIRDWEAQMAPDELKRTFDELLEGGHAMIETVNRRKDGSLIDVEISAVGIVLDGKKHLYAATRDITERKQIQQRLEDQVRQRTAELSAALDAAHQADQAKDEFLANITHELRTPLSAVIGFSSLARPLSTDARQSDYLDKVNTAGKTLARIIDDLLDLSKISAGRMEFEAKPFSLRRSIARSLEVTSFKAQEKGLMLVEKIAAEVPDILIGDSLRMEQILLNLLSNAVKFTSAGRVELRVGLLTRDTQRACLAIEVEDTGIGMDEDSIALLFKPFSQADASMTRKFGGTGLGLAICKRLCELMDGDISVSSREGHGSTFHVTLHLALGKAGDAPAAEIRNEAAQVCYRNARVLVVDDQPFNRDIVEGLLAAVDIAPYLAENGQEALDMLAGPHHFDLVMMDIQMPVLDGLATTRRIRRIEGLADLPIIAMTAHAMAHEREKSLGAGMNDHIAKPFDEAGFYRVLAKWIPEGKQYLKVESDVHPVVSSALPPISGVDTQAGLALLLGDAARYRHWLNDFVVEAPATLDQIRQALAEATPDAASMAAHTLKGRMGLLGMKDLHTIAAALEAAIDQGTPASELLLDLERGVAAICKEIRQELDSGAPPAATDTPAPGTPLAVPPGPPPGSVKRLLDRLQAGDSDCNLLLKDCMAELKNGDWAPYLQQALIHVENFDYAAAAALLSGQRQAQAQEN